MSRLALEVERRVKEMNAEAEKARRGTKGRKANKEAEVADLGDETTGQENQLTGDSNSGMTVDTDLSGQEEASGGNDAVGANVKPKKERKPPVAKQKNTGAKKAKAPKAPKAAKAPKAPKGERKPREKKVASGKLKKIEASGTTYLTLEFEEGSITLTPTGNREENRDIAVKALRALL